MKGRCWLGVSPPPAPLTIGGRTLIVGGWEVARPRGREVRGGSSGRTVIGPRDDAKYNYVIKLQLEILQILLRIGSNLRCISTIGINTHSEMLSNSFYSIPGSNLSLPSLSDWSLPVDERLSESLSL